MKHTRTRTALLVAGLTALGCTGAMSDPSGAVAAEKQIVAMTSTTRDTTASTESSSIPAIDREAPAAFRTATFALG